MTALAARDAEGMLRFVALADEFGGDDPFVPDVLRELGRLIRADWVGYSERDLVGRRCLLAYDHPSFDEVYGRFDFASGETAENPLCRRQEEGHLDAIRLVDLLSDRALRRTSYYHLVLAPLGVTDRLAAALPSPPTHAKRFFFDRVGGAFSERDRDVLEALRPHLGRLWRAADTRRKLRAALAALGRSPEAEPQDADAAALTPRERQILGLVAQGKTNPEIAEILWIAPTTVRKHLEHVYAKLGVRTRTAAVTRFLAVDFPPARSSNR